MEGARGNSGRVRAKVPSAAGVVPPPVEQMKKSEPAKKKQL